MWGREEEAAIRSGLFVLSDRHIARCGSLIISAPIRAAGREVVALARLRNASPLLQPLLAVTTFTVNECMYATRA